ncbi:phage tail family protein [Streptomyces sp. V4-01]|uniref:Phage tail family protein n=1 Tax=Actinacidiphila polyblastidii TaxID=3110430 RepID=A0ABU7P5A8_9ACTN|nr:phage tail family protein [Streptomyces sp. V4-01]
MPILVASVPAGTVTPPPFGPLEAPEVTWTDAQGRVTVLSDDENGWVIQPGATGLDMPTYQVYSDESPEIDGSAIRQIRAQARTIMLPVVVFSDVDRADFLAKKRGLRRSLNPKLGAGTLTITETDGTQRSIAAYYQSGGEGDESVDVGGMRYQMVAVVFVAPSPYWLGPPVHLDFQVAQSGSFFPLLPLAVADSQVLGDTFISNDGDDVAYPVWTIRGPATSVILTNIITGQSLTLSQSLTSSDTVVIDTRERIQTVLMNGSTNLWPKLATGSALWGLAPADNEVALTLAGATTSTLVSLDYQPRYLSA